MIFLIRASTSTSTLQTCFHLFFVLRCFLIKNLTSDLSNAPLPRCPAQIRALKLQNVWLDLCRKIATIYSTMLFSISFLFDWCLKQACQILACPAPISCPTSSPPPICSKQPNYSGWKKADLRCWREHLFSNKSNILEMAKQAGAKWMYSLTRANEEPKIKVGYIHSNISYVLQHIITQHVVFPFYQCEIF